MTSEHKFPIASEYTLVAVSNPKLTGMCSFYRSPSIVLGQPMTFVLEPFIAKYSASRHALVLESSPPITTRPSRSRLLQLVRESANCFSVSILCLPLPRRKNDVREMFYYSEFYVSFARSESKQIVDTSCDQK